jgi:hypothetical protein
MYIYMAAKKWRKVLFMYTYILYGFIFPLQMQTIRTYCILSYIRARAFLYENLPPRRGLNPRSSSKLDDHCATPQRQQAVLWTEHV